MSRPSSDNVSEYIIDKKNQISLVNIYLVTFKGKKGKSYYVYEFSGLVTLTHALC